MSGTVAPFAIATTLSTVGCSDPRTMSVLGITSSPSGPSRNASSRGGGSSRNGAGQNANGVVGSLKSALGKASGPAVAIGAAAAGVAGGLVLKNRTRRKRVLGVPLPRSIGKASLSDIDLKSMAKTVGKASKQLGQTSKNVSKDIERVGDQAERVGKILS